MEIPIRHLILSTVIFTQTLCAESLTKTFQVTGDTWVHSANRKVDTNFDGQTELRIKDSNKIGYLKFDLLGLTGEVTAAKLHVKSDQFPSTLSAHWVSDTNWEASSITWNTRPSYATTAIDSATLGENGEIVLDVSSVVTGDGSLSFSLISASSNNYKLGAMEGGDGAYLEVVYTNSNKAPEGASDVFYVTHSSIRKVSSPGVLENDSDPNGDAIHATLITAPGHGQVALASDGSFSYTANTDYVGEDSFSYKTVDIHGSESSPLTVTLHVDDDSLLLKPYQRSKINSALNITTDTDLELDLRMAVDPPGSPQWRSSADQRIEDHRKSDLTLLVLHSNGEPLVGAEVTLELNKKRFTFGGVLDLGQFSGKESLAITEEQYKELSLEYFDAAGLENGLKPKLKAGNEPQLPAFFEWADSVNLPVRGHLLMWPGGTHMSETVDNLATQIELSEDSAEIQLLTTQLRTAVNTEIMDWAIKWSVYEWDVVNETLSNHRLQDILGEEEVVSWFESAEEYSKLPGAGLLINDYQIISGKNEDRIAPYKEKIDALVAGDAPISGIGFQSRFKFKREDPTEIYNRLELFSGYKLDLVGTEFEVKDNEGVFMPSERLRAQITAEVMLSYFSHPRVTGLFSWDFINPDFKKSLVKSDGSPRLNGLVWYYINRVLLHNWHRYTSTSTTETLTGFNGDYTVTVKFEGATYTENIILDKDLNLTILTSIPSKSNLASTTITANEDTHTYQAQPNVNFSSSVLLQLRDDPYGNFSRVSYIKFDLHGLPTTLTNPVLRLRSKNESDSVKVYAIGSDWNAHSLTASNQPNLGSLLAETSSRADKWMTIPLPSISPSTVAFAIKESGNSLGSIYSTESAHPPQLMLSASPNDNDLDAVDDLLDKDDDNDHIPDSFEIRWNTNPIVADSILDSVHLNYALALDQKKSLLVSHSGSSGTIEIQYASRQFYTDSGGVVTLEYSENLTDWTELTESELSPFDWISSDLSNERHDDGDITKHSIQLRPKIASSSYFFRSRVE